MFLSRRHRFFPLSVAFGAGALLFSGCHRNCGREGDPQKQADKIVDRMKRKLDLNSEQEAKIRVLAHEVADSLATLRGLHQGLHAEILKQLRSPAVDTAALGHDVSDREARFHALRPFLVRKFSELHALLTPQQREKLAAFLEKHRGRHGHD